MTVMFSGTWTLSVVLAALSFPLVGAVQKSVFTVQASSVYDNFLYTYNINFSMDTFLRFYDCLRSATSCKIHFLEGYFTDVENVIKVINKPVETSPTQTQSFTGWSSFCERTMAGELECIKYRPDKLSTERGVIPTVTSGISPCQCVYIANSVQVFFNDVGVKDCSGTVSEIERIETRSKRASKSSRRSRSSRTRSRSFKLSSSNTAIVTRYRNSDVSGRNDTNSTEKSSGLSVDAIVGISLGASPFVFFLLCSVIVLKMKIREFIDKILGNVEPQDNKKINVTLEPTGQEAENEIIGALELPVTMKVICECGESFHNSSNVILDGNYQIYFELENEKKDNN